VSAKSACPETAAQRGVRRGFDRLRVLALCWLSAAVAGCSAPPIGRSTRPVNVEVRDAESGRPLPDALVSARTTIGWLHADLSEIEYMQRNPGLAEARTDASGRAVVPVVILDRPYLIDWRISADGYFSQGASLTRPPLPSGTGAHHPPCSVDPSSVPAATHVRYMYKLPRPTIDLVLPDGWRGPVLISIELSDRFVQGVPGQRRFTLTVPAHGHLHATVAPLLAFAPLGLFDSNVQRARFAGGVELPIERRAPDDRAEPTLHDPTVIALRLVRRLRAAEPAGAAGELRVNRWLYVVGTQAEAEAANARLGPKDAIDRLEDEAILRRARATAPG
jgi:hypothetical protein